MSPESTLPEFVSPIDDRRLLIWDTLRTETAATALLMAKHDLVGILPEPLNVGYHVGNFGMTMGLVGLTWMMARNRQLGHEPVDDTESYKNFIRRMTVATVAGAVALNAAVEYAPLRMRELYSSRLTTSDPLDVAYGIVGGLTATVLMSAHLRKRSKNNPNSGTEPRLETPPTRAIQQSPVSHRPVANRGGNKAKRKMQQNSRKKNR